MQGTVKIFKDDKGYGFIKPNDGSNDVFVHGSALPPGAQKLEPGDKVSFELAKDRNGKIAAANVRLIVDFR